MTLLVVAAVALCTFLGAFVVLTPSRRVVVRDRIAPYAAEPEIVERPGRDPRALLATLFRSTELRFEAGALWRRLDRLRERSGVHLRTVELAYASVGAGALLALVAALATGSPALVLLGLIGGVTAPSVVLTVKAGHRVRAFDEQLPDIVDALAASLRSGHSFDQALKAVAADVRDPAADELERVLLDLRLGRPAEDAFDAFADRIRSADLKFVLQAIAIQRQVGGSLAELLEIVAGTVRQRQQFSQKVRALTATGRLSGYILVVLPFVVALLLTLLNSSYMSPLFHTGTGHLLLAGAAALMVTGSVLLRRIVSIRG